MTRAALRALGDYRHVSLQKAERELGYRARPLAETIADSVRWFRDEYCAETNK